MDKKNTMLLTVIAVATLLVAVVGATFAYFTASQSATGTTTVTATTEVIGAVAISNPTTAMKLNLKAIDMDKPGENAKSYFATISTNEEAEYVTAVEYQPVARIAITGGKNDTVYSCSYTMTVTADEKLQTGDAFVYFDIPGVNGVSDVNIDGYNGTKLDATTANTFNVTFKATGNVSGDIVRAGFELVNKTTPQDHLKNEQLDFSVSNGNGQAGSLTCTVVSQ